MLRVVCSKCDGENRLMEALREQRIGIGGRVLFGFRADVDAQGELTIHPSTCENLGSSGRSRGTVPSWLMPVEVEDTFVPTEGTYDFQFWVEPDDRIIRVWHNPDIPPQRVDTILAGMAEEFEDPRNVWDFDLI